jgi:alpha-L-rhamnosidase
LQYGTDSASGWADVAVLLPWQLYQTYGDVQILRHQFCSMKRWVDCMAKNASHYLLDYKLQFGDWVALDSESDSYFGATPTVLTSTAYFAHSTRIFSYVCRVLGKHALADEYATLAQRVRDAYQKRFFEEDGRLSEQTQTAHIITLVFDLVPKKWRAQIANQLVTLLRASGGHLLTGFLGTPYFCQALSDNGLSSEAYSLLLQTSYPSWLYQVKAGATTIWEHWDGIKQDGTFWSPEMNSFNHYAYGAVGSWLYAGVLGITMQSPGYQHILIHPRLDARLGFAEGGYQSGYGRICMRWEISEHLVHMQIEIPANTTATVILDDVATIMEHDKILFTGTRQKKATIGSGTYTVTYRRRD